MKLEGEYMTVSEIAEQYDLSPAWVRRLAQNKRFPHAKQAGKTWLIPKEDIEAYLASNPKPGRKHKGQ